VTPPAQNAAKITGTEKKEKESVLQGQEKSKKGHRYDAEPNHYHHVDANPRNQSHITRYARTLCCSSHEAQLQ